MSVGPERTEPATPAPPTPPTQQQPAEPVGPSMAAFGGSDSCPNCGARMAADQRYCLNCGHRRGEPRLPFMDAVVFMESMSSPGGAGATPPPPSEPRSSNRMNANAALIAGVATLVLAIGVGFLIGRSGHNDSGGGAAEAPIKVIEVGGGGGGGGEEATASTEESGESAAETGKSKGGKSSSKGGKKQKKPSEVKEGSKEEEELAQEKTAEVLHTENGVELESKVEVGGKCKEGAAGCGNGGEFTGEFFGE